MADFTFTCAKCKRKVPTNQVRVLPDGKHICFECAKYSPSGDSTRSPLRMSSPAPSAAPSAGSDLGTGGSRVRYQCGKCKYEFWLKDGHAKKCPYCNSDRIEEKKGAAQKILDMHMNLRNEE